MRRFQGIAASIFACACVAGCGKTNTLGDAPSGDSNTTDANTTPDAALAVTVTTYSRSNSVTPVPNHTLVADVPVYVVTSAGAIDQMGMTNAQGTISFLGVAPGSSVTAVYTVSGGYKIVTTVGVKPGDNLVYGDVYRTQPGTIATPGTMNITFPTVANATQYEVHHPCNYSDSGAASPVAININCDLTSANLYVLALDQNFQALATATLHGVAYGPGQTANITQWNAVTQPLTASVSGLEAVVRSVGFHFANVVDGVQANFIMQGSPVLASGAGSVDVPVPTGGDRLFAFAELYNTTAFGPKEAFQTLASTTRTATFTEPSLPWMGPLTWDMANQKVSWTTDGTGAYDGMVFDLAWSIDNGTLTNYDWTIVAPPGMTQFSWANPPAALAPYLPAATDTVNPDYAYNTGLIDLSNASDYDQLRQQPEWFINDTGYATEDGELPTGSNVALWEGGEGYSPY
jgi:hypothetical protein